MNLAKSNLNPSALDVVVCGSTTLATLSADSSGVVLRDEGPGERWWNMWNEITMLKYVIFQFIEIPWWNSQLWLSRLPLLSPLPGAMKLTLHAQATKATKATRATRPWRDRMPTMASVWASYEARVECQHKMMQESQEAQRIRLARFSAKSFCFAPGGAVKTCKKHINTRATVQRKEEQRRWQPRQSFKQETLNKKLLAIGLFQQSPSRMWTLGTTLCSHLCRSTDSVNFGNPQELLVPFPHLLVGSHSPQATWDIDIASPWWRGTRPWIWTSAHPSKYLGARISWCTLFTALYLF